MKSSFWVAVATQESYSPEEYTQAAGNLVNLFEQVLNDPAKIALITKNVPISRFNTELEVSHNCVEGLVGKCVIDIESEQKVALDKPKLSTMFKSMSTWPDMKIEKRTVTPA